jgi:hypothetical protein
MNTTTERKEDKLIITKEVNAIIDFKDILANVKLEHDEDYKWFDYDGYEHEVISADKFAATKEEYSYSYNESLRESLEDARGYFWRDGWREYSIILIDKDKAKKDDWGNGWNKGASKQVQAENIAANIQTTIAYIKKVYTDRVSCFGIVCDYEDEDGETYSHSCWGFESEDVYESDTFEDCRDSYIKESMRDIAMEVVCQLEKAGYTVINQKYGAPDHSSKSAKLQNYIARREYGGINADNWKGDNQSSYKAKTRYNRRHKAKVEKCKGCNYPIPLCACIALED